MASGFAGSACRGKREPLGREAGAEEAGNEASEATARGSGVATGGPRAGRGASEGAVLAVSPEPVASLVCGKLEWSREPPLMRLRDIPLRCPHVASTPTITAAAKGHARRCRPRAPGSISLFADAMVKTMRARAFTGPRAFHPAVRVGVRVFDRHRVRCEDALPRRPTLRPVHRAATHARATARFPSAAATLSAALPQSSVATSDPAYKACSGLRGTSRRPRCPKV